MQVSNPAPFNRTAYGIEICLIFASCLIPCILLIAPLMELKSGSNVHDIEQKILLIAPLMELKCRSTTDKSIFTHTFNRTAYGIEIPLSVHCFQLFSYF